MRPRTPEIVREEVIDKWLNANSRNRIAEECGLGRGTVTSIINEWNQSIGKDLAVQLRELALALRKAGLALTECATGFRVALCLKSLGMEIDNTEDFLGEIYTSCKSKGLEPRNVTKLLEDIVIMFEGLNSISAISDRIISMRDEEESLRNSITPLEEKIKCLVVEKTTAEGQRELALENYSLTEAGVKWCIDVKEELNKYGILVDDITKFTATIKWIAEQGYDPMRIVKTYSDYQTMKIASLNLQNNICLLENDISKLEENKMAIERSIESKYQLLLQLEELNALRIGLKELRIFRLTINEIARANNLNIHEAWKKLIEDISHQYDLILGFEPKIREQQAQHRKLLFRINYLSDYLGKVVADTFLTTLGEEQRSILTNIINNHPDIAERVANRIAGPSLKANKMTNPATGQGKFYQDKGNGDIAGLELNEHKDHLSKNNFNPGGAAQQDVVSKLVALAILNSNTPFADSTSKP